MGLEQGSGGLPRVCTLTGGFPECLLGAGCGGTNRKGSLVQGVKCKLGRRWVWIATPLGPVVVVWPRAIPQLF